MTHVQKQYNNSNSNSNNKWKITSILSNGGSGTDLANVPARPPWRPAAATVQIGSNALALPASLPPATWRKQRSNQLTVPPQYVSATELVAALPKRQRMPRPQAASTQFMNATMEVAVVTPASSGSRSGSGSGERSSPRSEKAVRSAEGTPNSVLDAPKSNPQSAHSSAMRSRAGSPPSCPRSAQLSPSQSTRARSTGHDRSSESHQSRQSSQHSASTPASTPRLNSTDTTQADKNLPSRGSSGSHSSRVMTSSSMQSQRHAQLTPGHSSLGPGSPKSLASEVSMRNEQGGEDRRASPPSRRASPPSPSTIYKTPLFNTPPASHQEMTSP